MLAVDKKSGKSQVVRLVLVRTQLSLHGIPSEAVDNGGVLSLEPLSLIRNLSDVGTVMEDDMEHAAGESRSIGLVVNALLAQMAAGVENWATGGAQN